MNAKIYDKFKNSLSDFVKVLNTNQEMKNNFKFLVQQTQSINYIFELHNDISCVIEEFMEFRKTNSPCAYNFDMDNENLISQYFTNGIVNMDNLSEEDKDSYLTSKAYNDFLKFIYDYPDYYKFLINLFSHIHNKNYYTCVMNML